MRDRKICKSTHEIAIISSEMGLQKFVLVILPIKGCLVSNARAGEHAGHEITVRYLIAIFGPLLVLICMIPTLIHHCPI